MSNTWKKIVELRFKGKRFEGHALDAAALTEVCRFQELVTETAKILWKTQHPDKNLPRGFEEKTKLFLRKIEEGSAVASLETNSTPSPRLFPDALPSEIASDLIHAAYFALGANRALPEAFSKQLVWQCKDWGKNLSDNEEIEIRIQKKGKKPARLNKTISQKISDIVEKPYMDTVDVTGAVLAADVRQRRFQLWKGTQKIEGIFSSEQETKVLEALAGHESVKLRIKGKGEHLNDGTLVKILEIMDLEINFSMEFVFDKTARPIEEELQELAKAVPQEEWDKLPSDLIENLDHYIYGTPKK